MNHLEQVRAIWSMVANDEYRCTKIFIEIEKKKWLSAELYEEYYIIKSLKEEYDNNKISILSPAFIANFKKSPFIEYFTNKKMDELRNLLDKTNDTNINININIDIDNNDDEKTIQLIIAELDICRNILHTTFPELRKKVVKRKTADLDEQLPEREHID